MTAEDIIEKILERNMLYNHFCPYDFTSDLGYIPPCEHKKYEGESCYFCMEMLVNQLKKEAIEEYKIKSADDGR